jgi:hypothetical protein
MPVVVLNNAQSAIDREPTTRLVTDGSQSLTRLAYHSHSSNSNCKITVKSQITKRFRRVALISNLTPAHDESPRHGQDALGRKAYSVIEQQHWLFFPNELLSFVS